MNVRDLPPFKLEQYLSEREFTARYMMCGSDADSLSVEDLIRLSGEDGRNSVNKCWLGYTQSQGSEELRAEIHKLYDSRIQKEILCFAGAEEGIFCLMNALLEKSDHAVVVTPCYESLWFIPSLLCETTALPLKEINHEWQLDLEQLKAVIKPHTKLIVINFPHNPTGAMISKEVQQEIIKVAESVGAYILSDEVYRLLESDSCPTLPGMVDQYLRGISLGVMSKALGLAGLRIGWIATRDHELLSRMTNIKHYLSICNSAPSEALSILALRSRDKILSANKELVAINLLLLNRFFSEFSEIFSWIPPAGGCVGFPLLKSKTPVGEFAQKVEDEEGVLILPGTVFDWPENRFRVSVGRRNFPEALKHFRKFVERNLSKLSSS